MLLLTEIHAAIASLLSVRELARLKVAQVCLHMLQSQSPDCNVDLSSAMVIEWLLEQVKTI